MNRTRVLALLPLFIGLAQSFSWDIVVGEEKLLKFYNNGTLEHAEVIPAANNITAVTYDPVYDRVLFADFHDTNKSISSFDISTREIQLLVNRTTITFIKYLAYDPITQLLFWEEGFGVHGIIYSFPLKPAAVDGNVIVDSYNYCGAVAVDSCGGFIYWATDNKIERAAFDGSIREVLIDVEVVARRGLAIDQKTQSMYWIEEKPNSQYCIESADLNGKNRRTFYFIGNEFAATDLSVSKDFIYWRSYDQSAILRLPKSLQLGVKPTVFSNSSRHFCTHQLTAASYKSKEQTMGIKKCEALKSLILDVEERYCHNYCFQGNCSISAERQPICRCNAGYSGERCEVNACLNYCSNNSVCSLNEEQEPVCQCTAGYVGERCDVATTHTGAYVCADKTTQQMLLNLRSEMKQVREDLQYAKQHLINDNQQDHNETLSKLQT